MPGLIRFSLIAVLSIAGAMSACHLLLPERFAVNAPMLSALLGWQVDPPGPEAFERRIRVAAGFRVEPWARVPGARFLRPTSAGDLLVSAPREGRVVLVEADGNGDGQPDGQRDLLTGLDRPHGLDLHEGWLYVAEGSAVFRVRFEAQHRAVSGQREVVVPALPDGGNHWTKTARVGPDGALYVSVGSSCNVCEEEDERRAAILRFPRAGGRGEIFARGLRNAVGFDWQPGTGDLYATDNGRDLLGDDFPPCELNRIVEGGDYGWPFANGDRVIDPDLGAGSEARVAASTPPAHAFAAHNAPLGIAFLSASTAGEYRHAALVALHGSWNRTAKDGYKVVSLHWQADGTIVERDFLWGFLLDEDVVGRPVDVAQGPDDAIYVTDDYTGTIYRVTAGEGPGGSAKPGPGGAPAAASDPLAGLDDRERAAGAARGAALWQRFECAGCHDPAAADPGVVPVPLVDLGKRWGLDSLAAFLAAPTPPMPAFPLSSSERRDLAIHMLDVPPGG
ncbi:MAG: oxidoreductase [Dehalococcoidia bacterium]|jgi:glucose/arabinose dehydrogenase|nr:oxidoreductase [Dehalococcoidia bacterium]